MDKHYDVIIVGGGPAGLSAAIYMARAKYRVLVVEKEKIGGQITITSEVVNYPGIPSTSGTELTEGMRKQAERFGAEFLIAEVQDIRREEALHILKTSKGERKAVGVILAAGANPRKLGFEGETKFQGRGVAYCATCDGEFFTGMDVFVIGGGFAAAEEAVFLTKYAKKVKVIVREPDFTCARTTADEVKNHDQIEVCYNTEIIEAGGGTALEYAVFKNRLTGDMWKYEPASGAGFGIFVFAGYVPASDGFKNIVELDEMGYIITDYNQKTSADGIYAAGDICIKNLRQVVTAVSDGAIAATSLERYVSGIYEKYNLTRYEQEKTVSVEEDGDDHLNDGFITEAMRSQLAVVFEKFEQNLVVKAFLDDRPVSNEITAFLAELGELTGHISCQVVDQTEDSLAANYYPSIQIWKADGTFTGLQFHGVPGGHEFNSFIIALYNAAGPGQQLDEELLERIRKIDKKVQMRIMVSLSCTMCPELVMAAQKIAVENENVQAEMYDLIHFPEFKEKYNIMSVPCMIINDQQVVFGKKDIPEILGLLEQIK